MKKKLEELNLLDDFLFGTLISHPVYGERFAGILIKTILNRDVKILKVVPQMNYYGQDTDRHGARLDVYIEEEDGALNLFLYTKGKIGVISQELKELLQYLENTTWSNAVSEPLREVQNMVDKVKYDKEVSISYMKSYERDWMMRNEGLEEGLATGRATLAKTIQDFLSDLGTIPKDVETKINNETDLDILTFWIKLAAKSDSIEEFVQKM